MYLGFTTTRSLRVHVAGARERLALYLPRRHESPAFRLHLRELVRYARAARDELRARGALPASNRKEKTS